MVIPFSVTFKSLAPHKYVSASSLSVIQILNSLVSGEMLQVVLSFQNSVKVTYVRYVRRFFNFKCVLQRGGRSIFWWTGNKKFQYGISRFWEKYGPETVFSTLDSAGNY